MINPPIGAFTIVSIASENTQRNCLFIPFCLSSGDYQIFASYHCSYNVQPSWVWIFRDFIDLLALLLPSSMLYETIKSSKGQVVYFVF